MLVITNAGGAGTIISDLMAGNLYHLNTEEIVQLEAQLPSNWSKNNPVDIVGDEIYVIITPQFMTDALSTCRVLTSTSFKTCIFPVLLVGQLCQLRRNI